MFHPFSNSVEIVGAEHVPRSGPVIFIANHQNQFVDGLLVLTSAQAAANRDVAFLVAEKRFFFVISIKQALIFA